MTTNRNLTKATNNLAERFTFLGTTRQDKIQTGNFEIYIVGYKTAAIPTVIQTKINTN
jgi:hypothetical protein